MGSRRPTALESRRRTVDFLTLIAEGVDAEKACREARLSPWRALRIVTESDFNTIVQALREGMVDAVVVEVSEEGDPAAAA